MQIADELFLAMGQRAVSRMETMTGFVLYHFFIWGGRFLFPVMVLPYASVGRRLPTTSRNARCHGGRRRNMQLPMCSVLKMPTP